MTCEDVQTVDKVAGCCYCDSHAMLVRRRNDVSAHLRRQREARGPGASAGGGQRELAPLQTLNALVTLSRPPTPLSCCVAASASRIKWSKVRNHSVCAMNRHRQREETKAIWTNLVDVRAHILWCHVHWQEETKATNSTFSISMTSILYMEPYGADSAKETEATQLDFQAGPPSSLIEARGTESAGGNEGEQLDLQSSRPPAPRGRDKIKIC